MDFNQVLFELASCSKNDLDSAIEAGKILVKSVWGSLENWESSSGKSTRLKDLIQHPAFPFSKASSIRKMHLYKMNEDFEGLYDRWPGLYLSHFEAAIYWDDKEKWLDLASDHAWSVATMRERRERKLQSDGVGFDSESMYKKSLSLLDKIGNVILEMVEDPSSKISVERIVDEIDLIKNFVLKHRSGEVNGGSLKDTRWSNIRKSPGGFNLEKKTSFPTQDREKEINDGEVRDVDPSEFLARPEDSKQEENPEQIERDESRCHTYNGKDYWDFVEITDRFPKDGRVLSTDELRKLEDLVYPKISEGSNWPKEMIRFVNVWLADVRLRVDSIRLSRIMEKNRREDLSKCLKEWETPPWTRPGWKSYTWVDAYVVADKKEKIDLYFRERKRILGDIAKDFSLPRPKSIFDDGLVSAESYKSGGIFQHVGRDGEILEPIEQYEPRKEVVIPSSENFIEISTSDFTEIWDQELGKYVLIPRKYVSSYKKGKHRKKPVEIFEKPKELEIKANVSRGSKLRFGGEEMDMSIDPDSMFDRLLGKK